MGAPYMLLLSVFYLAGGIFIFLLGLTILRAGGSSAPTRATALMLFFAGIGPILSATSIIVQSTLRPDAVVYRSMMDNFEYLWEFYFPSLLLFSLAYPREQRFLGNFVLLSFLVFAPYIVHLVTIMAGDALSKSVLDMSKELPLDRSVTLGEQTISLAGSRRIFSAILSTLVGLHKQLFLVVNITYASVALMFLSRSMRLNLNPRVTGQLRTVLIGLTVSIAGYALSKMVRLLPEPLSSEGVSLALTNFALVAGGGSVAYAVIKQQFLGIRYVARKTILYGAASVVFAGIYLLIVKPVSDYFGQYSVVSKEAFETGFIIMAIIAFQPLLYRIEEILEGLLLRGVDDLQARFTRLGSEISNVTSEDELEGLLRRGFGDILDATDVRLNLDPSEPRFSRLVDILKRIGGPILRQEMLSLGERGRLGVPIEQTPKRSRRLGRRGPRRSKQGLADAMWLVAKDDVFVPIFKERKCVGYVSLGEKTLGLRYNTDEIAQISSIANQIGTSLDNIRLLRENVEKKVLEEELVIARRVQLRLLPSSPPEIDGYQLSASTVTSRQVGGDYYDFGLLDGNNLALVIADVSGKGIPASLLMATLHAAVNSNHDAQKRPAMMLQRLNSLLYESTSAEEFATVFYGVVDLVRGRMKYANAGHEFPYIVSPDGITQLAESGIVLGAIKEYRYEEKECQIPRGGGLILFTDGVTDAERSGGECFGQERFRAVLGAEGISSAAGLCKSILDEVEAFSKGGDYHDDLTLVVLNRD